MRIRGSLRPHLRAGTLAIFFAVCAAIYGVLWVKMGGQVPGLTGGYRVKVAFANAENLVYDGDVRMAGVQVGKVRGLQRNGDAAVATLQLGKAVTPLHSGATVRLRTKSLVEETYVEIVDGKGAPIPAGGALPKAAEQTSVQLQDVLNTLDAPTRAQVGQLVRNLSAVTAGRGEDLSATVAGLGQLGREGHDVLDALASQSTDLKGLVANTAVLLDVLDEGNGQIARLADGAAHVSTALANNDQQLRQTVQALPTLVDRARTATEGLHRLTGALTPVVADLRTAAPDLNASLVSLAPTVGDLNKMVPALDGSLQQAPATLHLVPSVVSSLEPVLPTAYTALRNINPMLAYLEPYKRDLVSVFTNFGAAWSHDAVGTMVRVMPTFDEGSFKSMPIPLTSGLHPGNPYPPPNTGPSGAPFNGTYPKVEEEQ